jgi:hypothetical protein
MRPVQIAWPSRRIHQRDSVRAWRRYGPANPQGKTTNCGVFEIVKRDSLKDQRAAVGIDYCAVENVLADVDS